MNCFACNAEISNSRDWAEITLAPGHTAKICRSRNGTYAGAKLSCEKKAREIARLCPGCGDKGYSPGEICGSCRNKIARSDQHSERNFGWYVINCRKMMPYLTGGQQQEGKVLSLSRLLARIAANEGRVTNDPYSVRVDATHHIPKYDSYFGDCPAVEMSMDQYEAMMALGEEIGKLMRDQRRTGKQEGLSLLVQLGRGEVTIDEFEDRKVKMIHADEENET